MAVKGNFLLQTRMVLQAMIGGADLEKVRRHWPGYVITVEDGKFSFELAEKPEAAPPVPPAPPPASPPAQPSELELAAAAAAAAAGDGSAPQPLAPVM